MQIDTPPLSTTFSQRLPEFLQEDSVAFIDFMKAYYKWIEEKNRPRSSITTNNNDIDVVDEALLTYFINEYMQGIPVDASDVRKLIKKIKEFYRAKGSVGSFTTLFNILGDETASITAVSSYEPISEVEYQVVVNSNPEADFIFQYYVDKLLRGATSSATGILKSAMVETVGSSTYVVLKFYDVVGVFAINELLMFNTQIIVPNYTIQSQLVDISITNGGYGYAYTDTVNQI